MHDEAKAAISRLIAPFFSPQGSEYSAETIYSWMERPPEASMGEYALPCFRFAKALRKAPPEIAVALQAFVEAHPSPWIEKVQPVGAFLNFFVPVSVLMHTVFEPVESGTFFSQLRDHTAHAKERVMIEFSQPNTHKEFHIGHARNVSLGDALTRVCAYNGYTVVPVNYIGDEGTHVAKCLWEVLAEGATLPTSDFSHWYGARYAAASQKLAEASPEQKKLYDKEISQILLALESKTGPIYELWQQTRAQCVSDFERIYRWFDVHFDHVFYESDVSEECQGIVDEYLKKGLFYESEGAIGMSLESEKLGFFLARKSDGTTLYITKDLALARRKFTDFAIDRSINVVGNEQNFHFRQLFHVLKRMGFPQADQCYHLSYAHVKLPEGRKMSSRSGQVVAFAQLVEWIEEELKKHLAKYEGQWTPEQIADTLRKLAVGTIRYGMLDTDPHTEIVFDPEVWTSFEGNTGPYLMYSYARSRSILRKSAEEGITPDFQTQELLQHPIERELLREILEFNAVVESACKCYRLSLLTSYLYHLCKLYNRFYAQVPVRRAETESVQRARLALVSAFGRVLAAGLHLLGITPPESM
jgi:arginyl-tRNA synthetase